MRDLIILMDELMDEFKRSFNALDDSYTYMRSQDSTTVYVFNAFRLGAFDLVSDTMTLEQSMTAELGLIVSGAYAEYLEATKRHREQYYERPAPVKREGSGFGSKAHACNLSDDFGSN